MWEGFVELLRLAIFSTAQVCGGSLGTAVMLISAGVRLALLPLTLRSARHAREQQEHLVRLAPQLEALQRRWANDPVGLLRATRALHAANGIRALTPSGVLNLAVQLPLLSGLFAAVRTGLGARVRFLWIGDLSRPDLLLLGIIAGVTALAFNTTPVVAGQARAPGALWLLSVTLTVAFLWSASSAVALSMGAGSVVSVLQNWMVSRENRRRNVELGKHS
jgi:YidC/Oxa1 family membrane protein insertase